MNIGLSLAQTQRSMLLRPIYLLVAPIMLLFAVLACGTMVTQQAYYTCSTAVPPTPAPQPTVLPRTPLPFPTMIPLPPTPYLITRHRIFTSGMPCLSVHRVRRCVCVFGCKMYRVSLLVRTIW